MKNHFFPYLFFLFVFQISFSQNQDDCNFGVISAENFNYEGCRNYEGKPNGMGKYSQPDGLLYNGMFKDFKFHGYGSIIYPNGVTYKGYFVEDKQEGQGEYIDASRKIFYQGSFENNMFSGLGELTISSGNQTQVKKGTFYNDNLQEGTNTITTSQGLVIVNKYEGGMLVQSIRKEGETIVSEQYGEFYSNNSLKNGFKKTYQGNLKISQEFKNGEEISRSSNIDNQYIPENIIGSNASIEIDLEIDGNTKYLNLNFETDGEPYRFVFDTGAESFVIGYLLFQELKLKGLKYQDMDIQKTSIGVSGIPFESKVIKIHEIFIGSYSVKNVFASVPLIESANSNLLGISFMKKFKDVKWSLNDNKLTFEK